MSAMDNTRFVIALIIYTCIDQGDGHWKERDRENIQHDIVLYRKMAEKIEREIESFYDEYPVERYKGDNVDRIHYKHATNILDRKTESEKIRRGDYVAKFLYGISNNITRQSSHDTNKETSTETMQNKVPPSNNDTQRKTSPLNSTWPKFEDILLAMGRKYDWKNDRWIKVKEKMKKSNHSEKSRPNDNENSIEFHEKHKFSYRIVKLNRSKSRRNVVVAVSAVR